MTLAPPTAAQIESTSNGPEIGQTSVLATLTVIPIVPAKETTRSKAAFTSEMGPPNVPSSRYQTLSGVAGSAAVSRRRPREKRRGPSGSPVGSRSSTIQCGRRIGEQTGCRRLDTRMSPPLERKSMSPQGLRRGRCC